MKLLLANISALMAVLLPSVASACPYCAGNNDTGSLFWWVLGSMVLLPFPVFGTVFYIIRKGNALEENAENHDRGAQ